MIALLEQGERFLAVDRQDYQECAALGWQWLSIRPYVVAGAAGLQEAIELAAERGHEDVLVYDRGTLNIPLRRRGAR